MGAVRPMIENEVFICPSCQAEVPVVFKAATGLTCIRCHNQEIERRLRLLRAPGIDEIRKAKKPSFHDD